MDKQPRPQPQPQPQEQERHERGAEAKLLRLSLLIRVGAVAALVLCFLLAQQFDSSAQLLALTLDPQNRHGLVAGPLSWLTAFVRWDTVYFLSIANPDSIGALGLPKGGYAFEQMHAFQPAVPLLLRAAGYVSPDLEWSPTSAVILVTLLANVATLLAPVLLYRLTLRHTGNHDIAWKAAVLSTICPSAGTTLSSPTPEPFFSLVSLAGMLLLAPTRLKSGTLTDTTFSRRFQAALCFAAATSFRANGVLLAGFLIWDLFWTRRQSPAFALRILEASVHVPLAVSPFVVSQVWAHMRFCVPGQERPWCTSLVPSVYAFVQEHYWCVYSLWQEQQQKQSMANYGNVVAKQGRRVPAILDTLTASQLCTCCARPCAAGVRAASVCAPHARVGCPHPVGCSPSRGRRRNTDTSHGAFGGGSGDAAVWEPRADCAAVRHARWYACALVGGGTLTLELELGVGVPGDLDAGLDCALCGILSACLSVWKYCTVQYRAHSQLKSSNFNSMLIIAQPSLTTRP